MKLSELKKEPFKWEDMYSYFRLGNSRYCTFIKLSSVKECSNPYAYIEEEPCQNHICRVLSPEKTYNEALVIRDDGTVWKIRLDCFKDVVLLAF